MDNPKNIEVKVRFSKDVNEKLLKYCKRNEITRAEAVRRAVDLLLGKEK